MQTPGGAAPAADREAAGDAEIAVGGRRAGGGAAAARGSCVGDVLRADEGARVAVDPEAVVPGREAGGRDRGVAGGADRLGTRRRVDAAVGPGVDVVRPRRGAGRERRARTERERGRHAGASLESPPASGGERARRIARRPASTAASPPSASWRRSSRQAHAGVGRRRSIGRVDRRVARVDARGVALARRARWIAAPAGRPGVDRGTRTHRSDVGSQTATEHASLGCSHGSPSFGLHGVAESLPDRRTRVRRRRASRRTQQGPPRIRMHAAERESEHDETTTSAAKRIGYSGAPSLASAPRRRRCIEPASRRRAPSRPPPSASGPPSTHGPGSPPARR